MMTKGYGETMPVSGNETAENRQKTGEWKSRFKKLPPQPFQGKAGKSEFKDKQIESAKQRTGPKF
jgi:hypothetical protein